MNIAATAEGAQGAFRALADPSRRAMLAMLRDQDMTIGEVAGHFPMTRAAVKKHLIILEQGGLITVQAKGRERVNSLIPDGLQPVTDWLAFFDRYWDDRLADLKHAVEAAAED